MTNLLPNLFPNIFDEFTLRGVTLRNRIGVSPMCEYSAENGMPCDWHLVHLGSRAAGGAGLVISEATATQPQGRISPQDTGIWSDAHAEAWAPITRFIASQGAVAGIQLAHAGRKASTRRPWDQARGEAAGVADADGGWEPVAPSALAFEEGYRTPRELTAGEIGEIVQSFADSAPGARTRRASTGSSCTGRTATSCTSSCRPCPTRAPTPTAALSRTASASRWM